MAEDSEVPSLPRRLPPEKKESTAGSPAPRLPESVVRRILGVLADVRADAAPHASEVDADQIAHHAASSEQAPSQPRPVPGASDEGEPGAQMVRQIRSAPSPGVRPDEDPTEPLPVISASAGDVTEEDLAPPEIAAKPMTAAPVGQQLGPALTTPAKEPTYRRFRRDQKPFQPDGKPAFWASQAKLPTRLARRPRPKASAGHHRGTTRGVALAIAVLSVGLLVFLLTWHSSTEHTPNGDLAKASPAAIRNRAAAWVAAQVSRAATVSCDRIMCQALEAHGIRAASLLELVPGKADPLRSRVLVVTAAVRSMIKSPVTTYAPIAIAVFGSGRSSISIRVIAPRGATTYSTSLRADLRARKAAGAQLLENQQISVSAVARRQLGYGQIDSRLLAIIASLAARCRISVVSFGDLGPGASPGIPFRSANLSASGGPTGRGKSGQVQRMAAFVRAQKIPYLASNIQTVRLADGRTVLRIEFAAPSPLGLLAAPKLRTGASR